MWHHLLLRSLLHAQAELATHRALRDLQLLPLARNVTTWICTDWPPNVIPSSLVVVAKPGIHIYIKTSFGPSRHILPGPQTIPGHVPRAMSTYNSSLPLLLCLINFCVPTLCMPNFYLHTPTLGHFRHSSPLDIKVSVKGSLVHMYAHVC